MCHVQLFLKHFQHPSSLFIFFHGHRFLVSKLFGCLTAQCLSQNTFKLTKNGFYVRFVHPCVNTWVLQIIAYIAWRCDWGQSPVLKTNDGPIRSQPWDGMLQNAVIAMLVKS